MYAKELRKKTIAELQELIKEKKVGLTGLVTDILKEKEKDFSKIKKEKKIIARINTVIAELKTEQKNTVVKEKEKQNG